VLTVGLRSASIATPGPGTAPISVRGARVLTQKEPVYDLTIDGEPEYYANGVLIHNTMDALGYIATRLFHRPKDEEAEEYEKLKPNFRSHASSRYS